MTSSAEAIAALLRALHRHPRQVLTSTELAVRSGVTDLARLAELLSGLHTDRAVVVREVHIRDPHLPVVAAVALVGEEPDAVADAERRARACAASVEREFLRSHRCQ